MSLHSISTAFGLYRRYIVIQNGNGFQSTTMLNVLWIAMIFSLAKEELFLCGSSNCQMKTGTDTDNLHTIPVRARICSRSKLIGQG